MATIIDIYTLTENEEKALIGMILQRIKDMDSASKHYMHPGEVFETRIQKVMMEKLVSIYHGSDNHPGYWPKHPGVQQNHLAEVTFFPITINGVTLAPEYVLYLRNMVRELYNREEYRNVLAKQDVAVTIFVEHFFRQPYFDTL